jgi:hypothetical protein
MCKTYWKSYGIVVQKLVNFFIHFNTIEKVEPFTSFSNTTFSQLKSRILKIKSCVVLQFSTTPTNNTNLDI